MKIHVVKPGDTIYSIGLQYRVSPQKIIADNELDHPGQLVVGQTIVIMEGNRRHVVAPGESLYSIAKKYGVSVEEILSVNPQITNPARLTVGQIISIPPASVSFGRTIEVNGYAFPNIEKEVLDKTLPNLTYLSIFSHQATAEGNLTPINDTPLIQAARAAKVAPLMVVTNIGPTGGFNSDIAHAILTDAKVQDNLVANIIRTLREKNYYGLDLDIEYIYPYDRESYNNFVKRIVTTLRPMGYTIASALAPKTSATQQGKLYEAHDYAFHGQWMDHVILMTYEWGFTYSPPMAVAPIDGITKVLDYAVTAIPREKILMGIPNYGYDWTLPWVQGTAARTVTNTGAVDLARRRGAVIKYDYKSQAPFFNYYDDDRKEHVVWFDDARSILAKLTVSNEYKLGGVSYWTINKYFPQNWLVLKSVYDIKKVLP